MVSLLLTDIIKKTGIEPENIMLIRHALSNDKCREYIDNNMVVEYTCVQKKNFTDKYDYWLVFLSGEGTTAILDSFYKVKGKYPNTPENMPEGFAAPEDFDGKGTYFELEKLDTFKDFEHRLTIEWGKSTHMWHHRGTTEKEILSIESKKKIPFSSYEEIRLTYPKLKEIVDNPEVYSDWHTALSVVNGVYLIVDTESGMQYVGSAYGQEGILQRWEDYVNTKDGGNKKLKELLDKHPDRYKSFQFSILKVLPYDSEEDDVIATENNYKDKLLTRKFGLNAN